MKTWIKRTLIGALGATVLLGGLSACSHHRGPMSEERLGEMRGQVLKRVSSQLDLNPAQQAKLNALADELMAQRQALRGSGEPLADLQTVIAGPQFDRAKAQALLDQKTQAVQGMGPKMIVALGDFYDSLNPEQQAKLRSHLAERRHGGWWSRG